MQCAHRLPKISNFIHIHDSIILHRTNVYTLWPINFECACQFLTVHYLNLDVAEIIFDVNNDIVTNIDIKNEFKYLLAVDRNFSKLDENKKIDLVLFRNIQTNHDWTKHKDLKDKDGNLLFDI